MSTIDLVLAGLAGYGLVSGFFRGVVKEMISLAMAVMAFIAALLMYPRAAGILPVSFAYPEAGAFAAFLVTFATPIFAAGILLFVWSRIAKKKELSAGDRLIGGAVGIVRGGVAATAVLVAALAFPLRSHPLDQSLILPAALHTVGKARALFPQKIATGIQTELDRLQRRPKSEETHGGKKREP